jgi:hypothetical protein
MRLVADSGLWSSGPVPAGLAALPLVAVLEVSGAVLSWTVDEPTAATQITFTDLSRADWLWRVVGESGHVAVASTLGTLAAPVAEPRTIELTSVDIVPGSVGPLRRLAVGHWLRRWWPASRRDGIAGLDRALLDVEVALLTVGAQGFFTDDTLDSDVAELLVPHAPALIMHVRDDDPRIRDLVRAGVGLADDIGIDGVGWPELFATLDDSTAILEIPAGRGDDYALVRGVRPRSPGASRPSTGVRFRPQYSMRARTASSGASRWPLPRWWPSCGRPSSGRTRRPASRCGCGPEPSTAAARWTPPATPRSPWSTRSSDR